MDFAYPVTFFDYVDYFHTWAQFAVYAVCAAVAFRRSRRGGDRRTFALVACAFVCFAVADLFVNLYITIYNIYPYYFSVAELSWISIYAFFAAVCLNKLGGLAAADRAVVMKRRAKAFIAAALVVVPFYAVFIILTPDQLISHLLYGFGNLALLYPTALLLFAAVKDNILAGLRGYHVAILVYVGFGLAAFLFSCLYESALYNLYYVFNALLTTLPIAILHTLGKGDLSLE